MNANIRSAAITLALCALLGGPLYGCASTSEHRSTGQYIDDAAITSKVKAQLLHDSVTEGLNVDVETSRGTVQLSGFVDNEDEKDRAGAIARNVAGVKSVKNDLVVQ